MSEPIFAAVERELGYGVQNALHDAERLVQRAAGFAAHPWTIRRYDSLRNPLEAPVSALADVETKIKDFAADFTAKLEDLVTTAPPVIHDGAESLARLSSSKIVVELEQLAQPIDPALEEVLAGMIRTAGAAAAKVAELTAAANPPAETEPAPAPADPQVQTGIAV